MLNLKKINSSLLPYSVTLTSCRAIFYALFGLSLGACTQIDNYLLGKDNTPSPAELSPIRTKKTSLLEKWSLPSVSSKQKATDLQLKPAILGSTLYVAESKGTIKAMDRFTGKMVWSKKINHTIVSGPTVAAGYMAVGTDAATIVLMKQDGTFVREFNVSSDVLSKPLLLNDTLIAKTMDGKLYAFEIASGKTRWVADHGAPSLILKASSAPVKVGENLILVGYPDGQLDAIDLTTGRTIWQRPFTYTKGGASDVERLVDIDADPLVEHGIVYLASYQGYVGALSLQDGQFIWRQPASVYKNMVMDGRSLYFTDSDDVIWSIDKHSGHVRWKQEKLKARGLTEPVLTGKRLVFGDKTGMLHVLAVQDGEFLSRTQLNGAVTVGPSIANSDNNLYVMTNQGQLSRFAVS